MEECPYALSLLRFLRWCQKLVLERSPEMTGLIEQLWKLEMIRSKMIWDPIPQYMKFVLLWAHSSCWPA